MSAVTSSAYKITRLSYAKLFSRHLPTLGVWGVSIGLFCGWPYLYGMASDKMHHVPNRHR